MSLSIQQRRPKSNVLILLVLGLLLSGTELYASASPNLSSKHEALIGHPAPKFKPLDALLKFYQQYLSNQIQADCLYHTSCSRFTRKKLKEDGLIGFFVGLDQFIHCTAGMELDYPSNQFQSGKVVRE